MRVVFFAACVMVMLNLAYILTGGPGNEALSSFNGIVMNNYSIHTDKIIYTPNVHQNHQRADFQLGDSELDGLRKALSISDTLGYDTLKSTIALFVVRSNWYRTSLYCPYRKNGRERTNCSLQNGRNNLRNTFDGIRHCRYPNTCYFWHHYLQFYGRRWDSLIHRRY
jgi:hypothetical protein